jgi:Sulfotransferase domain
MTPGDMRVQVARHAAVHAGDGVSFLGIGVQKAATSWLHDMLSQHPEVLTSDPKELDFFTSHYDRGYRWYHARFLPGPRSARRGECSPSYFCSRSAPDRAYRYNPELRLFCILRDPVKRAFSNHLHEVRKQHIPAETPFEAAMLDNPMYVEQGRYARHLRRWIETFGRDRLLVLLAEDIAEDPASAFRAVCRHIGVRDDFVPEVIDEQRHESVTSRDARLQRVLRRGGDTARALGFGKTLERLKGAPGIRDLLAMNRRDLRTEVPAMRTETVDRLADLFEPDRRFVALLLGRPALPWTGCNAPADQLSPQQRDAANAT